MDLETTNSEMPSVHSGSETAVDEQERNWVYPSPSQFYTAVTRKNHDVRAEDMNVVVPIHNAVNEEAWRRILEWERSWKAQGSTAPHLVNFVGRPKDLTWRAWFRSLAGYQPPFDRHDWVIARPNPDSDAPRMMRYIIDFYAGRPSANAEIDTKNTMMRAQDPKNAVAFYLDVRPAPDSAEGIAMRLHQIWRSFSPS
ncbi:holocytochrome-c synthase [Malassezia vespertilionis]|uniref:Holocytochrome c-type synthase n=1 Tax=Malassezia vespertilionis TaxID=2020962 RepID=A0A2N1JCP3_9BASI|nr:holocytochrome-c synthase [Malassezia vespertilionis]PKI84330.1 Cyt2p [Malassezia vespertilionis]WFD06589.1 holocytochrome-c synthase [Malassezia vespertilionis]